LTEEGLASLGYSDTIIFRPGGLRADREKARLAEKLFGVVTGALSRFSPSFEIRVETLAKSMRIAGILGSSALPPAAEATKEGKGDAPFTLISNRGAVGLAKTEEGDTANASAST
jgi:oxidoreductase